MKGFAVLDFATALETVQERGLVAVESIGGFEKRVLRSASGELFCVYDDGEGILFVHCVDRDLIVELAVSAREAATTAEVLRVSRIV